MKVIDLDEGNVKKGKRNSNINSIKLLTHTMPYTALSLSDLSNTTSVTMFPKN